MEITCPLESPVGILEGENHEHENDNTASTRLHETKRGMGMLSTPQRTRL